jgi:hypothetical protein
MKTLLMNYSLRAHEISRACDDYTCATGYQLGLTEPARHLRNVEREKYRQTMQFPKNIGLIPVAIFSIGVTYRLVTSVICAVVVRMGHCFLRR